MLPESENLDLVAIRKLFLHEARLYLAAIGIETNEQLKDRFDRIKIIEAALDEKKKISQGQKLDS
jgi:hypothetical protein